MSTNNFTRRDFLRLGGASTLTLTLMAGCARALPTGDFETKGERDTNVSPEVFAAMRQKWRASLVGDIDPKVAANAPRLATIAQTATTHRDSMTTEAGRTALWEGNTSPPGMSNSFKRLFEMALAYATPGQPLFGDEKLAAQIIEGLDWMTSHQYAPQSKEEGNWWEYEIGSPQTFTNTAILLYDKLSPAQRAAYAASVKHFIPDPTRRTTYKNLRETGANLSDKSQAIAIAALLTDDAARLTEARDALSPIFQYVTSGEGFYADGSFIQHGDIPYIGTYGAVLLIGLGRLFKLLAGTPWEVVDPNRKIVFDAVEKSYAPFIFNGLMMDGVNGRAVTRKGGDIGTGRWAMNTILLLAEGAPAAYAADYRARVKGWMLRSGETKLPKILQDASIVAKPEPVNHRLFADMDRAVHRRPGWALQISMNSTRIARYEGNILRENMRGWHQSDGMTYLYLDGDIGQFNADFWPTVNPKRLPGTTVDTRERALSSGVGRPKTARFVGGAVLDDLYGAVAQELEGFEETLHAKKSWFCLDDAIVCLGAGINSTDGRIIETIVENRNLKTGNETWLVNGAKTLEKEGSATIENVAFAHLEGVGGYLFPAKATLKAIRETRTGNWAELGGRPRDKEIVSRRYLTFWFDHGVSPTDATYAYALLPNATAAETARFAAKPNFEILSNSAQIQAVRAGNLLLANFWTAGKLGDIEVFAPCSLIIERKNGVLNVAVAHPGRTDGLVKVQIAGAVKKKIAGDATVSLVQSAPNTILEIKTAESRGHTHSARFAM